MPKSSRKLTDSDAAIAKALLAAGVMQSDIASLLCCNGGRIAEINTGKRFPSVPAANLADPNVRAALAEILAAWSRRVSTTVLNLLQRGAPDA